MTEKKLTKNEKREAAKTKAAEMRVKNERARKRRLITIWTTATVSVLAVGALITTIIVSSMAGKMEASITAPANMATNGVIATSDKSVLTNEGYNLESGTPAESEAVVEEAGESDKTNITVYLDYACPHCEEFEQKNAPYLDTLLQSGRATVEYKPIVVIGSSLSFNGGNAAACVANFAPDKFVEFNNQLFTLTATGGNNRSIRPLVDGLGLESGVRDQVVSCMGNNVFGEWLKKATEDANEATDAAGNRLVTGTPTVLVDGVKYPYSPDNFPAFVEQVLGGKTPQEVISSASN